MAIGVTRDGPELPECIAAADPQAGEVPLTTIRTGLAASPTGAGVR